MSAEDASPATVSAAGTGGGIAERFRPFPRSGIRVDPLDRALDRGYGLPPPPSPKAPAALQTMWARIFGKPVFVLPFVPAEQLLEDSLIRIVRREQPQPSNVGHAEDSGNWAGAFATANGGKHLGTMLGIWQVPPKLEVPTGKNPKDYSCSIWIGLDGQRRYFDSSLPQIGTLTQFKEDGTRDDFPWVQWWERDSKTNNFIPLKMTIAPGDLIGAFLHVIDPLNVWFVIVNLNSDRHALALLASAPVGGGQPIVFGATAEWILERPSHVGLKTMFDLPDFGQCRMEGLALQTPRIGAPLFEGDLRDMSYARMIRMLELRTDPSRTAIIAMPHRAGPTAVKVTHGGF